jgi:hypothetical protein
MTHERQAITRILTNARAITADVVALKFFNEIALRLASVLVTQIVSSEQSLKTGF